MGNIYLILEVDKNGEEAHKIGITKNDVVKRLNQLKTGNSNQLSILKVYQSENYKQIETMLHARYGNKKTLSDNEFFRLSDNDVINFISTCKMLDETINHLKRDNPFYK